MDYKAIDFEKMLDYKDMFKFFCGFEHISNSCNLINNPKARW